MDFFDKVYQIAYGPLVGKKKMDAFEVELKKVKDENGYATCLKNEIMGLAKLTQPGDKTACLLIYAVIDQKLNNDLGGALMPNFINLLPSIHIETERGKVSANIQDCEKSCLFKLYLMAMLRSLGVLDSILDLIATKAGFLKVTAIGRKREKNIDLLLFLKQASYLI